MECEKILKSSQEQAAAAWVTYLNKLRLTELLEKIAAQDINLESALAELGKAKEIIAEEIVNRNRGGVKGMHGFIAEILEVAFENAESLADGQAATTSWINNNGPADIQRGNILIQQKFVQKNFSLDAIKEHLGQYSDFLDNGDKYQVPKDFYEKIKTLWEMSPEDASRLTSNNEDGLTYSAWKKVQSFFSDGKVSFDDLEPAKINYVDAQKDNVGQTIANEESALRQKDQERRNEAYEASKPTLKEGAQATAVSAALEGGMALCLAIRRKRKDGKKLHEFTADDWKDIGLDTATSAAKGSVRGAGLYVLTNYTATAAPIASSLITAIFGVVGEARKHRTGELSDEDFIANSEALCVESAVSAVASLIGEVAIPIPVLGAVVGNAVGMFMYGIAKDYVDKKELELIQGFQSSMESLNRMLDERYHRLISRLKEELEKFASLLDWAFDPDVNKAFEGSIHLAQFVGVDETQVLKDTADINAFFMI